MPRLAGRAAENQKRDERRACAEHRQTRAFQTAVTAIIKEQGAALVIQPQNPEKKSHVADAGGDERFPGRGRRGWTFNPKADQQIRRQTDQFPKNKEQQQTVGDNDAKHCAREK